MCINSQKNQGFSFKQKLSSLISKKRKRKKKNEKKRKEKRKSEEPKYLLWTFLFHWSLKFHADFYKKYKTVHTQTPGKQQC